MKCKNILLSFILLSSFLVHAQNESQKFYERNYLIHFEHNQAKSVLADRKFIDSIQYICQLASDYRIELKGHTDLEGSDNYNKVLSEKRTSHVKQLLQEASLNADWISTASFGESKPVVKSEASEQTNRRVEIRLRYRLMPTKMIDKPFVPESSDWFYKDFKKDAQIFYIYRGEQKLIKGKDGTLIDFPREAFCSDQTVIIELREYYKKSEMLLSNMSTESNKSLLESGGMLQVEAYIDGKKVELCKEMTLFFPDKTGKRDMQLFDGQWDDGHENIDWKLNEDDPIEVDQPMPPISPNEVRFICGLDDIFGNGGTCKFFWCKVKRFFSPKYKLSQENQRVVVEKANERRKELAKLLPEDYDCTDLLNAMYADEIKKYKAKDYADLMNKIQEAAQRNKDILEGVGDQAGYNATFLEKDMNYLIAKTSNLGYINCDRFSGSSAKKMNVIVPIDSSEGSISAKLVVSDENSILNGSKSGDAVHFGGIPVGKAVTLIVLKYFAQQMWIAKQDLNVGEQVPTLQFEPYDKSTFEQMMREI
jgi:hypothetical protein